MSNADFDQITAQWNTSDLAVILGVSPRQVRRWRALDTPYPVPDCIAERITSLSPPTPKSPAGATPKRQLTIEERKQARAERDAKYGSLVVRRWEKYQQECGMITNEMFRELSAGWTACEIGQWLDIPAGRVASYRRKVRPARVPNRIAWRLINILHEKSQTC